MELKYRPGNAFNRFRTTLGEVLSQGATKKLSPARAQYRYFALTALDVTLHYTPGWHPVLIYYAPVGA